MANGSSRANLGTGNDFTGLGRDERKRDFPHAFDVQFGHEVGDCSGRVEIPGAGDGG